MGPLEWELLSQRYCASMGKGTGDWAPGEMRKDDLLRPLPVRLRLLRCIHLLRRSGYFAALSEIAAARPNAPGIVGLR